ncbi:MAG: cory-CC-star protein [Wenzhouxiangella sp.]
MKSWLARAEAFLEALYHARHRRELARIQRDREDLLMLMVYADTLGIDHPAAGFLLELRPVLAGEFHAWHRRMGLAHSPLDCPRCC